MPKEIVELEIYPRGSTTCDQDCPYFCLILDEDSTEHSFCELFYIPLEHSMLYNKKGYITIANRCKACLKHTK